MTTESANKFNQLMEDKEFVMKMLGQESEQAVQKLLAENGVEMTIEEVDALGATMNQYFEKLNSDELDEDSLENVAGGFAITLGAGVSLWAVGKAIFAVGAAGLAVYKWYKSAH